MREIISRHNPERFEIYLFALHEPVHDDELTQAFSELGHGFINLYALSSQESAKIIADCDLDLLVDLAGHTTASRPEIYRYRPARVIVTHLGYHGCIGLPEVDYKITDQYADLPENREYQFEGLLPLSGCVFPFLHVEPDPPGEITKAKFGLEGKFVFATFVNLLKLSPRCLHAWRVILERVPNAVLAFSLYKVAEQKSVERVMQAAGIDASRLIFLPAGKFDSGKRARYYEMDAVLDTFPYCGGDTTLAALDMNVPVVTLVGQRHAERIGLSILTHLGVTDTVAYDEAQYIELAVKIATDRAWRDQLADKIRLSRQTSPFADMNQYVRSLEAAYETALRNKGVSLDTQATMTFTEFQQAFQAALKAHQSGDLESAQAAYRALLIEQPDYVPLNYFAGVQTRDTGHYAEASGLLLHAIERYPQHEDALLALGNLYLDIVENKKAEEIFQRVLTLNASQFAALNGLGLALTRQMNFREAVQYLKRANQAQPDNAQVVFNLGLALHKSSQTHLAREASEAYTRALALQPDYAEAAFNFGVLLAEHLQWPRAEELFRRALSLDEKNELAYWRLREVLMAQEKIDAWLQNQAAFKKHFPQSLRQMFYEFEAFRYRGELVRETQALHELMAIADGLEDDHLAEFFIELLMQVMPCHDVDIKLLARLETQYAAVCERLFPKITTTQKQKDNQAVLRIAYVSAHFCDDAVGRMWWEVLSRHDREKCELYLYGLNPRFDALTGKFAGIATKLTPLLTQDGAESARIIAADQLDVLIDLDGYEPMSRPALFAAKSAPVQIAHTNSALMLPLDSMDYCLTDDTLDLPSTTATSKSLFMDGGVFPFVPAQIADTHPYIRATLGAARSDILCGAFVSVQQLSLRCLTVWKQLLEREPRARLVFSTTKNREGCYRKVLAAAGIKMKRVIFIPPHPDVAMNLGRYSVLDVVLDPFPCGDVYAAQDALNANIPVITLIGQRRSERRVYSLLQHLDLSDTAVHSGQDYIDIALKAAIDAAFRATLKEKMRQVVAAAGTKNIDHYTAQLEKNYRVAISRSMQQADQELS